MDVRRVTVPVAAVLLSGLLGGLLAGCGSDDDELITSTTADSLHAQVQAVREAVAEGRTGRAESAVANLRENIRRLATAGEIDSADALVLLTQVDRLAAGLEPPATPTPTPTPKPETGDAAGGTAGNDADGSAAGKPKGDPSDNGKGKGKGKKK